MTRMTNFFPRRGATLVAAAVVFVGTLATLANAQPVSRSFERNAPAIGDAMPDVVVYDRDGDEHRLRDLLSEHYTVLILGCLT